MASQHDNGRQEHKTLYTRRNYITWLGQIVAGISLAGIGLGLNGVHPINALAATTGNTPAVPDCIQCPSYGTFCCRSCNTDSNCQPGGHIAITYYYKGGCVAPGQECPTYAGCTNCVSSCPTNC
jgi:hypothetical protein